MHYDHHSSRTGWRHQIRQKAPSARRCITTHSGIRRAILPSRLKAPSARRCIEDRGRGGHALAASAIVGQIGKRRGSVRALSSSTGRRCVRRPVRWGGEGDGAGNVLRGCVFIRACAFAHSIAARSTMMTSFWFSPNTDVNPHGQRCLRIPAIATSTRTSQSSRIGRLLRSRDTGLHPAVTAVRRRGALTR